MSGDLYAQQETLRQLTRTDPDPRVRRRAHTLLLLTEGHAVVAVARLFATAPHRVRAWRSLFLASGRHGAGVAWWVVAVGRQLWGVGPGAVRRRVGLGAPLVALVALRHALWAGLVVAAGGVPFGGSRRFWRSCCTPLAAYR